MISRPLQPTVDNPSGIPLAARMGLKHPVLKTHSARSFEPLCA